MIVQIMNLRNVRSRLRLRGVPAFEGNPMPSCDSNSADWRFQGSEPDTIEVGDVRSSQVGLRQAAGACNLGLRPDQLTQDPQEFAMSKTAITSPELSPPVGPFSQAIEAAGFLYFSGQVAQDPATGKVVEGGILSETERIFQNLSALLKAAGKSFDDVVRAGVYLTSMTDFAAMNGIYAKYFSQPFPARTTIAAAALPLGACVEIDLVVKA